MLSFNTRFPSDGNWIASEFQLKRTTSIDKSIQVSLGTAMSEGPVIRIRHTPKLVSSVCTDWYTQIM